MNSTSRCCRLVSITWHTWAVFTPETLEIAMVSFEGPDQYSQAGGLGVRAKEICRAFAAAGFRTSLYFVGEPDKPHEEVVDGLRLVRICQSVSRHHPAGVYDGEHAKIQAMWEELPPLLTDGSVRPAAAQGRVVAIMCEEWHTADFVEMLDRRLRTVGLRERCVILWNANNHFGFDNMDWRALDHAATVTTVSRYMKHLMWPHGVNPMVIPNGIPTEALQAVDAHAVKAIFAAAHTPCLAFKIGRFSPDKRWHQSLDAIATLRAHGMAARLLMRGGIEHFGHGVLGHARQLGLDVAEWNEPIEGPADVARSLADTGTAAVVNLRRFLPDSVLPAIAAASTAVLANSGHEPFGLVGLEAMAAGGVAIVGATGEEYARPYGNAIVVETADGTELASALSGLVERPELSRRLRRAARRDAADYAWPEIIDGFLERMRYVAARQQVAV
jgi:glycosyltransferase involved in cell wall biosynthesis